MQKVLKKEPLKHNTSKLNSFLSTATVKKEKSLVDPSGGEVFQLSQSEIDFINTESGQIYEITLGIRNVGEKSKKIKLKKPKS